MSTEHNADDIPALTKYEKERKFSMNNNRFFAEDNMNNNNNDNQVRDVERSTSHTWQKYAAVAAAFVLLAGGIGGSIALGKHMDKNSKHGAAVAADAITTSTTATTIQTTTTALTTSRITTTVTSTATEAATTTMAAVIETTAPEVITAAPTSDKRNPEDLDAFANEWKDKYEEYLWKIVLGGIKHEENPVSFKLPEGSVVDKVDAWKVTDEEYCSADAINAHLNAFWAPGIKNDIEIPDLTEKIDNATAEFADFTYSDFTKGIFFTYNNELYRVASNCGLEGIRTEPTAEKINDNEMLVHWELDYEGVTDIQTMHLVWIDEINDWRVDDIVEGSKYFGKLTEEEAAATAKELFSGYKEVHNAFYGIGVEYDDNKRIAFRVHTKDPSCGEWYIHYSRVADNRFANTDDVLAYLNTKYTDSFSRTAVGADLTGYRNGYSFLESYDEDGEIEEIEKLQRYIMYNGDLYLCTVSGYSRVRGLDNFWDSSVVDLEREHYVCEMKHDPEVLGTKVSDGNSMTVNADKDSAQTEDEYGKECGRDSISYFMTRNDSGEWRISSSCYPA